MRDPVMVLDPSDFPWLRSVAVRSSGDAGGPGTRCPNAGAEPA